MIESRTEKDTLRLKEIAIPKGSNVVYVPGNRFHPNNCMWVCRSDILRQTPVYVIFPGVSNCHILVGEGKEHQGFIHLTPLTSLFRRDTSELRKVNANLASTERDWRFQVYYLPDNKREEEFRRRIAETLGENQVDFVELSPSEHGEKVNLAYLSPDLYVVRDITPSSCKDVSHLGLFNTIPISAFE